MKRFLMMVSLMLAVMMPFAAVAEAVDSSATSAEVVASADLLAGIYES